MRILSFISACLSLVIYQAGAQTVRDALFDYFHQLNQSKLYRENDALDFHYSPQTQIYCFAAAFTGSKQNSFFITDEGQYLNAHGNFGWTIYVPVKMGGYRMATDESTLITAGMGGPPYIGYIDQIKRYGLIVGTKDEVTAYYLKNGRIHSTLIDNGREHANSEYYPKYFRGKPVDYHIKTYTLDELSRKYGIPISVAWETSTSR